MWNKKNKKKLFWVAPCRFTKGCSFVIPHLQKVWHILCFITRNNKYWEFTSPRRLTREERAEDTKNENKDKSRGTVVTIRKEKRNSDGRERNGSAPENSTSPSWTTLIHFGWQSTPDLCWVLEWIICSIEAEPVVIKTWVTVDLVYKFLAYRNGTATLEKMSSE